MKIKVALLFLTLIGLGFSAPQPRKLTDEQLEEFVEEFLDIIMDAGQELKYILFDYLEFDEFVTLMQYIKTKNFKDLVYEIVHLPEFQPVVEILENAKVDIHYLLKKFNETIDNVNYRARSARRQVRRTEFAASAEDSIAVFPKKRLSAFVDQKMAEEEEFRTVIENLRSEEWDAVFSALWASEVLQVEVKILAEKGIDIHALLHEIAENRHIFGQRSNV